MQRPKMPSGMTDPVCQRRAIQSDALAGVNLGLAIQQQMVGILGHQNLGDNGLGRQTAHDRSAAQAPGLARHRPRKSGRHIWAELRPHHIQPLTPVLADPVQLALAARTGLVVDVDDDLNPRQMRRRRSPVDPALVSPACRSAGDEPSVCAARLASACPTSSRPSSIWSSGSVSALRPKWCRCSSFDLAQSFVLHSLGEQHRFQRFGISGSASFGIPKSDHSAEGRDDLPGS
jgi:hypothetical protein